MLCAKPITLSAGYEVPCGQCMNCRINKKRFWVGRILAEAAYTENATFWGLTYAEENVPTVGFGPYADALTLRPKDLTDFIKRWRKMRPVVATKTDPLTNRKSPVYGESFRYFAVGEYGDLGRPHYHVIAFGPALSFDLEDRVKSVWQKGRVSVSELVPERAAYCAGYTIKKMTKHGDNRLLEGQFPEFFRVSRKPPLGHRLFEDITEATFSRSGSIALVNQGDVAKEFRLENRRYPLGRYWVQKLREVLDVPTPPYIPPSQTDPDYSERVAEAKRKEAKAHRRFAASSPYARTPGRPADWTPEDEENR